MALLIVAENGCAIVAGDQDAAKRNGVPPVVFECSEWNSAGKSPDIRNYRNWPNLAHGEHCFFTWTYSWLGQIHMFGGS